MNETWENYLAVIKRSLPWVGVAAVAAGMITAALARSWGPSFDVHFSYLVSLAERESAGEYTFDGYYALQATDLFVASLARWVTAPETVAQAYVTAGLEVPPSGRILAQAVKADKTGPQIVQVTVVSKESDTAQKLAEGVRRVVAQNVERFNQEGTPLLEFKVMETDNWVGRQEVAAGVLGTAVGGVVLFLLINAVLIKESWRQMVEHERG